jgi:hypothetical protein
MKGLQIGKRKVSSRVSESRVCAGCIDLELSDFRHLSLLPRNEVVEGGMQYSYLANRKCIPVIDQQKEPISIVIIPTNDSDGESCFDKLIPTQVPILTILSDCRRLLRLRDPESQSLILVLCSKEQPIFGAKLHGQSGQVNRSKMLHQYISKKYEILG